MAKLKIHRTPSFSTALRRVTIYVDNEEIGKVADQEMKVFEITPGPHEIRAELDWLKSKPIHIVITGEHDERQLLLNSAKNPMFAWYNMTIGRNHYLELKELK